MRPSPHPSRGRQRPAYSVCKHDNLETQPTPLTGTATWTALTAPARIAGPSPHPSRGRQRSTFFKAGFEGDPAHTPHGDGNPAKAQSKRQNASTQPTPLTGTATRVLQVPGKKCRRPSPHPSWGRQLILPDACHMLRLDPAHTPHGDGNPSISCSTYTVPHGPSPHPSRGRQQPAEKADTERDDKRPSHTPHGDGNSS